jgi:hypothetical protein
MIAFESFQNRFPGYSHSILADRLPATHHQIFSWLQYKWSLLVKSAIVQPIKFCCSLVANARSDRALVSSSIAIDGTRQFFDMQ